MKKRRGSDRFRRERQRNRGGSRRNSTGGTWKRQSSKDYKKFRGKRKTG